MWRGVGSGEGAGEGCEVRMSCATIAPIQSANTHTYSE